MGWTTPGSGTGSGGIVERMVGDVIFANIAALVNWSNSNLDQLRNNNNPITPTNQWNKSIAQVGVSPNQIVYQWDGDDQPSSFPTESAWAPRDRTLNSSEIKVLYESNANTNAFDDTEKGTVDSVQSAETGVLLAATDNGVEASGLRKMPDSRVMTETSFGVLGDGGIDIGPSVKQVDIGTQAGTRSAASQKRFVSMLVEYNRQTGWLDPTFPFIPSPGTAPETFDFQTALSETLTNPSFNLANTATRILDNLIFRAPNGVTNSNVVVRLRSTEAGNPVIKYIPNESDWIAVSDEQYVDEGGNQRGFTFTGATAVDNSIDIHNSPVQTLDPSYASLTYLVDFVANGDVQLLGNGSGVPYLKALGHAYNITTLTSRIEALASSEARKRYNDVEFRRQDFTLGFSGTEEPGDLYRVDDAATITVPASTSDDQLGVHWGLQNASPGDTVTLQVGTVPGHTIIIEGLSRPYDIPAGTSIDLVLVDRTATSSNYRIVNESNGLEGLMGVTNITATAGNIFGISGRPVHYKITTASSANYSVTVAGVGLLPQGESCRALVENVNATYGLNLMVPTGTQFKDTNTQVIAIEPGNSRWITITNNAGTLEVDIDGPVVYEFMLDSHDIVNTGDNKGDWGGGAQNLGVPAVLSGILTSPTILLERDRLVASTGAGFMLEFQFTADFDYGGTTAGGIFDTISVAGDVNDSGSGVQGATITRTVEHRLGAQSTIARTWIAPMSSGNHFNLLLNGFPASGAGGARMIQPNAYCRVIMKR